LAIIGSHWWPLVGGFFTKTHWRVGARMSPNLYKHGVFFPLVAVGSHWHRSYLVAFKDELKRKHFIFTKDNCHAKKIKLFVNRFFNVMLGLPSLGEKCRGGNRWFHLKEMLQ
jgi:hypothetical protein